MQLLYKLLTQKIYFIEPMKSKTINYRPPVIKKSFQTYIFTLETLTTYMTAISIIFKKMWAYIVILYGLPQAKQIVLQYSTI